MKKNIILLCLMAISSLMYSQVGINTPNPQGMFHVDGAKDNPATGTPSPAQQANDFTVTSSGSVGLGTNTPVTKLEINNGTAAGAIKIVDGTQGANKVLTSDSNGIGTWNNLAGSWYGLLTAGTADGLPSLVNFTMGTVVGSGGSADITTDAITVPTTALYEVTISGWTRGASSPYVTTWSVRKNGTDVLTPHYASPSTTYGTETSVTNFLQLNAGDVITLFLSNPYTTPATSATTALRVSLVVKMIQ